MRRGQFVVRRRDFEAWLERHRVPLRAPGEPVVPHGRLMTPQEAADILRIPREALAVMRRHKTGPAYYQIGGPRAAARYAVHDLLLWICTIARASEEFTRKRVLEEVEPPTSTRH